VENGVGVRKAKTRKKPDWGPKSDVKKGFGLGKTQSNTSLKIRAERKVTFGGEKST